MHELSLAQSIAQAVEDKAEACRALRVRSVRLSIGAASGVVIDSLTFCFEMIASQSLLLEGACLLVEPVAHRAYCRRCEQPFAIADFIARCPTCQSWSNEIISGHELSLLEMEIEPESEPALSEAL